MIKIMVKPVRKLVVTSIICAFCLVNLLVLFARFANDDSIKTDLEKSLKTDDPSSYYKSENLSVNKVKPGAAAADSSQDSPAGDASAADQLKQSYQHQIADFNDEYYNEFDSYSDIEPKLQRNTDYKTFINEVLLQAVFDCKPSFGSINNKNHYNQNNKFPSEAYKIPTLSGNLKQGSRDEEVRSKNYLNSFLQLTGEEMAQLKNSHKVYLEKMPQAFPDNIAGDFKGNGILYAGGGQYNWLVLISIKMLRDLGSKLPIEVFIPNENEYSVDLCNNVFPVFGAKCILMSDYIDTRRIRFKGYQLKSMALLLTSFENVLLLDSDNIPLKNPDLLFINEPFTSTGLVVWPDFWRRSTSPKFYEIANITVHEDDHIRFSYNDDRDTPEINSQEDIDSKISYHDLNGTIPEASSETGQLLINKKVHAKTLFLSLYYNFYGPGYYYPLLSQGQAGEGDKETILPAAHQFNLPYYQVKEFIREFGELNDDKSGISQIFAMGQYDPILDHLQSNDPTTFAAKKISSNNYLSHKFKNSELMFIHCNQPKLYPWKIDGKGFRQLHTSDGERRRLYSKYLVKEVDYDVELKIWETMQWILCKHGDFNIKGLLNSQKWCTRVEEHINFLKNDI